MKLMCLGALGCALISIYLGPSKVAAAIVNASIDDLYGDNVTHQFVNYYPSQNVWDDQTCGSGKCNIVPDKSQAFDNTYNAGTYTIGVGPIGIVMQFNGKPYRICLFRYPDRRSTGTAIYVFFILGSFSTPTINSANFTLDSNQPVLFSSNVSSGVQYDVLVFSQTNLSNTLHTLNISTSGPVVPIYVNFDYAIYT
jgi:hypothetical protein